MERGCQIAAASLQAAAMNSRLPRTLWQQRHLIHCAKSRDCEVSPKRTIRIGLNSWFFDELTRPGPKRQIPPWLKELKTWRCD
jgi:hypothetical protein